MKNAIWLSGALVRQYTIAISELAAQQIPLERVSFPAAHLKSRNLLMATPTAITSTAQLTNWHESQHAMC